MSLKEKIVGNFISECLIVEPSAPVSKAIGLMKVSDSYEVFAHVGNKVGTVTIRDILRVKNPATTKIETIMSFIPSLPPNEGLLKAARLMADYRLRALPIIQNNEVMGKIDIRSIVNEVKNSALGKIRVSKIMSPSPITLSAGEKVSKARGIMLRRRIDHLPVIEGGKVSGVVTSSHIVFSLMTDVGSEKYSSGVPDMLSPLSQPVEAIMMRTPLKFEPQVPIKDVAESMLMQRLSYSLVTIDEELQGIVTYRDFAKLISAEESKTEFPVYIVGLPNDPFEAEAAKIKFIRLINGVSRFLPPIMEARSIIKASSLSGQRKRYEVKVTIITAGGTYNYSSSGWDLPLIYDEIVSSIKKTVATKKRVGKRGRGQQPTETNLWQ
ncbi:MAG: CBS domain-containing protein [Candidatus Bathyarchaeia archaeon]